MVNFIFIIIQLFKMDRKIMKEQNLIFLSSKCSMQKDSIIEEMLIKLNIIYAHFYIIK